MSQPTKRRSLLYVVDRDEPAVDLLTSLLGNESTACEPERERRASWLMARLMRDGGYEVALTGAGSEAIRRVSSGSAPDALLLDVSLEQSPALGVARRARMRHPGLPIVVLWSSAELAGPTGLEPAPSELVRPLDYVTLAIELARVTRGNSGSFPAVAPPLLGHDRASWPGSG